MIRSFEARTYELDRKLVELQEDGWKIISVVNTPCKEWAAGEGYFDSVLFIIIAEHK